MDLAIDAADSGRVFNASVFGGFPLADVPCAPLGVLDEMLRQGLTNIVAGPGVCSSDYSQFNFSSVSRPIYPIDPDTPDPPLVCRMENTSTY